MKALVKAQAEPGLWLQDVPEPAIGPNDLLIKIHRTAVCGTDLHIYSWDHWASETIPVPMTVGHEFVGTVVDMGSEVRGYAIGDRVSGEGHINCGFCRNCKAGRRHLCRATEGVGVNRSGCFAEYLSLPAQNGFRLPDAVDDDTAAMLDPLGNAVHTALSFPLVGEDVLITGAGPIGVMAAAVARFAGARHIVVTDVNDFRLSLAQDMGATRIVNVSRESIEDTMRELGMQEGFDIGLEMSGNATAMRSQLELAVHGGHIALLGIPPDDVAIDWHMVIFKGLIIKGVYGREMFETWYKMVNMLQSGLDIRPLITHRFDYTDFQRGFDVLRSGESGKVLLNWD